MSNRVVYLSCMPLTAKIARDWYIEHLIDSGIDVEYWDLSNLLRGQVVEHHQQLAEYVREFAELPLLKAAVRNSRNVVYVILLPKIWKFRAVFRLLARYRSLTASINWGAMPAPGVASTLNVLRLLSSPQFLLSKIRNRAYAYLLNRSYYSGPCDLVFAAGQVMLDKSLSKKQTVPIALCDYDQYTKALDCERLVEAKYAVFLDIYLPFQSDLSLVGMSAVEPVSYFTDLNRFFEFVERCYGLEIVIAMHPKARYLNNEFCGRRLVANRTPELVKDAELVLCHATTSVSYAVLNSKPVWCIYTDEMEGLYSQTYMRYIRALSDYLQTPLLNASCIDKAELPKLVQPREELYAAYKKDFLVTPGVEGEQSKNIFLQEIDALKPVHYC